MNEKSKYRPDIPHLTEWVGEKTKMLETAPSWYTSRWPDEDTIIDLARLAKRTRFGVTSAWYELSNMILVTTENGKPYAYLTQTALTLAHVEIGLKGSSLSEVADALSEYYGIPRNFFYSGKPIKFKIWIENFLVQREVVAVKVPLDGLSFYDYERSQLVSLRRLMPLEPEQLKVEWSSDKVNRSADEEES